MDPKQALIDVDQLISDGEYGPAIDTIRQYWLWRIRGGFEPMIEGTIRGLVTGDMIADRLTDIIIDRTERT